MKNITLGLCLKIFLGVTIHVRESGKNFGAKSQWKIFQGRPRKKKIQKGEKNIFYGRLFFVNWSNIWEVWQFFINPCCVRVYRKLSKLTDLASVSQNRGSRKYFWCSCLAQSRLCILEWSNWAEILAASLRLESMASLFPFIILTNRYRVGDPPVVSSTLCHCVADRSR